LRVARVGTTWPSASVSEYKSLTQTNQLKGLILDLVSPME